MTENKKDIRGFPGPEHQVSSTPVFIFKFAGVVFVAVIDNVVAACRFVARRVVDFVTGRGLEVVIGQYRFYRDQIFRIIRDLNPGELQKIELDEAWKDEAYKKVEKIQKDHFDEKEEYLVFGSTGSWTRYRDFLKDVEKFFADRKKRNRQKIYN